MLEVFGSRGEDDEGTYMRVSVVFEVCWFGGRLVGSRKNLELEEVEVEVAKAGHEVLDGQDRNA